MLHAPANTYDSITVTAANGTAAAPSYSFTSQPGLGMFRQTASAIGFSANTWVYNGITANGSDSVGAGLYTQLNSADGTKGFIQQIGAAGSADIWVYNGSSFNKYLSISQTGNFLIGAKITSYNAVTTAGYGVPIVVAAGRVTAQSAANASIATYTVGAADGSFEVSANMNVTASAGLATTLTCTYTDEASAARTMIMPITQLSGSFIAAGAITGTGAWETPTMHIRCKAATAITILTSAGTFTTVTYTAEGIIKQTA